MPPFLSAEWIAELDAVLDAVLAGAGVGVTEAFPSFTVRQVVTTGAHGVEAGYRVTVSGPGIRVAPDTGSDPPADLTFVCDYETAMALNRGELSAQEAIETGRFEVRGRLDRITGARKMLVTLGDATRGLRATTTYDPEP